ncbi:MAG: hypothetical protein AAGE65_06235 [Planctomycetota bacterium]
MLILTIGGALAGMGLGAVSQWRGEHVAWGASGQVLGAGVIGLLVVGMVLAVVAGVLVLAVLGVLLGALGFSG